MSGGNRTQPYTTIQFFGICLLSAAFCFGIVYCAVWVLKFFWSIV